jgi:hypothetical protein
MLPAGLGSMRIVPQQLRIGAHLVGNKRQHGRWRHSRRLGRAAWMSKRAELDRETQEIVRKALGAHERQVLGAEHVVFGHLGGLGRDAKQARTLFGGEEGSARNSGPPG